MKTEKQPAYAYLADIRSERFLRAGLSRDEARPHLQTMFVEQVGDHRYAVSTDGHRMHCVRVNDTTPLGFCAIVTGGVVPVGEVLPIDAARHPNLDGCEPVHAAKVVPRREVYHTMPSALLADLTRGASQWTAVLFDVTNKRAPCLIVTGDGNDNYPDDGHVRIWPKYIYEALDAVATSPRRIVTALNAGVRKIEPRLDEVRVSFGESSLDPVVIRAMPSDPRDWFAVIMPRRK